MCLGFGALEGLGGLSIDVLRASESLGGLITDF